MSIFLFSVLISIKVPPLKSTPKFNPLYIKIKHENKIRRNEIIFILL